MTSRTVARILASLCVALALGCAALAVVYVRKADEARCLRDAADLGLVGGACR